MANLLLAQEDLLDTRVKVIELQKKSAVARIKLRPGGRDGRGGGDRGGGGDATNSDSSGDYAGGG